MFRALPDKTLTMLFKMLSCNAYYRTTF
jgi:hypothetical protein